MTTAAVVLAAGGGKRFAASGGAGHKLLAPFMGWTVVGWAMLSAVSAKLDATYVVVGAVEVPLIDGVEFVANDRWAEGLSSSLRAGVAAASRDGHSAVVVGLGDQPLVVGDAWRQVADTGGTIAVATYDGRRGHPLRLDRRIWPLLPKAGDAGAGLVIRRRPDLVVEVPCAGHPADIDTVADLERWS
ncbi:MAG TPA: nucleotidyltransferase family protein [Acidimicrobiales bacterium]